MLFKLLWHFVPLELKEKSFLRALFIFACKSSQLPDLKWKPLIESFITLEEEPIIIGYKTNKQGKEFPKYKINRIVGTVLDRNKIRHTVTLLTMEGVVTVKFYDGLFNYYNKIIKQPTNKNGKITNVTIGKSWFTRGNKLIINGIRRGDIFFPKKTYSGDSLGKHTVILVNSIDSNGEMELQLEKERGSN